jgi:xanthine dehydrogenase accessory factor
MNADNPPLDESSTLISPSPAQRGRVGEGADWIASLQRCVADRIPAVLVTVAGAKGSVPREPGARMIVTADRLIGTIGGGHLEWKATDIARGLLQGGHGASLQRFPLGASLGQCCGGMAQLLFEPVSGTATWLDALAGVVARDEACVVVTRAHGPAAADKLIVSRDAVQGSLGDAALETAAIDAARAVLADGAGTRLAELGAARHLCLLDPIGPCDWHIVLFGAGHVGQAVVRTLAGMPCRITWVDSRDTVFPARVPANTTVVATDTPEAEVDAAPAGAFFLVMTHSHPLDQALAEHILRRTDFGWFGLIGSATKRRQFERRLAERGIDPARFADMTCPIGVPGIEDKRPAAIAIAVAAQLLQRHESGRRAGNLGAGDEVRREGRFAAR